MKTGDAMIDESSLRFTFNEKTDIIKFDDTDFYRKKFNGFPGSKGIDILAESEEAIQLIEVKNCTGHESENIWRTSINNSKLTSAPRDLDVENRNSLDIEVAQKVVATLSCLYGAWTKSERMESGAELACFWKGIMDVKIPKDKKKLMVILFLEGNFHSGSRDKKMIMHRIQESIRKKLAWLNCQVSVVDSDTYNERYFKVNKLSA